MERILPCRTSWPLYGVAASRQIEAQAMAAAAVQPGGDQQPLMRRAGLAVAQLALAIAPHARRCFVAAGPGNNGGDGLEAATQLLAKGKSVEVLLLADAARLPTDAAISLRRAQDAGVTISPFSSAGPALDAQDIAIDALLGLGASRAPEGATAELIARLNALPCPVLAVDVPSGLDADRGQPLGADAVRADHTLALLSLKPGLFTGAGRDHAGTVWLDMLGVDPSAVEPDAWLNSRHGPTLADPTTDRVAARRHAQHKGSFGDVIVVAGAHGMGGAAVLAARAAHAAGAGRVWVASLDADAPGLDPQRPELMWRAGLGAFESVALQQSTVVCGCGGGDAVIEVLPRLLNEAPRLVLDADALNAIARDCALQSQLRSRADRGQWSILTPHPLEAARLLGRTTRAVQADRLSAAQAMVERFACTVVLKGSGSVIASCGERPCINGSGSAALATPGTGDVLAGWLGGCWSATAGRQDVTATSQRPHRLACAAVWWHGHAAETVGLAVLRAADLIEEMSLRPVDRV